MRSALSGPSGTVLKSRKGIISLYLLILLAICLAINASLSASVQRYHDFMMERESLRVINWVEVLVINRVKHNFEIINEKSETMVIEGCSVTIMIDGLKAYIHLTYNGYTRDRVLIYDDIELAVSDYY